MLPFKSVRTKVAKRGDVEMQQTKADDVCVYTSGVCTYQAGALPF